MTLVHTADIPDYELYREEIAGPGHFQIHLEPLHIRSRRHRWEIKLHRHQASFQIVTLESGSGEVYFDGTYHQFEAPAAIFLPPGVVHGFRFSAESNGQVLTALAELLDALASNDTNIAGYFTSPKILTQTPHPEAWRRLRKQFVEIDRELQACEAGNMVCATSHLAVVLVLLFRQSPVPDHVSVATGANRDTTRITALRALISRHFREHRPVEFYAGQFGLSVQHLNRIARQHTGCTVQELVARRIIAEAKQLLTTSHAPVREVAEQLGFTDHAYFSRFFARQVGTAPGRWRKSGSRTHS